MPSIIPALAVADIAASLRFYTETLGFEAGSSMPDADGTLMHGSVKLGDGEIMFGRRDAANPHDQAPLGNGFCIYTTVADNVDIDARFAHARAAGATVLQEPTDQFWGHRDWAVADPDGYQIVVSKVIAQVTAEEMREAALAMAPAD